MSINRREFIHRAGLMSLGIAALNPLLHSCVASSADEHPPRHWVWITPEKGLSEEEWKKRFETLAEKGFHGAIVQIYASHKAWYSTSLLPVEEPLLEQLVKLGRQSGLEVHAWMWTMPNNNPYYIEHHPEFFAVNGLGQPSFSHPAYVDYYRFMCPNQEGVRDFICNNVKELAMIDDLDGIHFDYIRLPDVIIAEALQPVYNIVQDREYPPYDYCYCNVCRNLFKSQTGIDPLKDLQDPAASEQWRQFRYNSVTNLVNHHLIPEAKKTGKMATAAVFPNWESVRQQWSQWDMDAFFPMLYHNFYNVPLEWIGEHLEKQIAALKKPVPVYSGLFLPSLEGDLLRKAIDISMNSGAKGVALFSYHQLPENFRF